MAEIVTPDILSNMGSLEKLITERGYTTATVAMNGENVVRQPPSASEAPVYDDPSYAGYGAGAPQTGGGVVPQQFVVPQQPVYTPQPQISAQQYEAAMAYAANAQRQLAEAERQRMEAEDQYFLDSISHLPQLEQDREILIRYGTRLEQQLAAAQDQVQSIVQGSEEERQAEAKEFVAWNLAMEFGLRWEDQRVQRALLASPDRETMDNLVSAMSGVDLRFVQLPMEQRRAIRSQQQARQPQRPAQVAAQVLQGGFPAAPTNGARGVRQTVKPHSGDIMGLIKSRGYQAVAQ